MKSTITNKIGKDSLTSLCWENSFLSTASCTYLTGIREEERRESRGKATIHGDQICLNHNKVATYQIKYKTIIAFQLVLT